MSMAKFLQIYNVLATVAILLTRMFEQDNIKISHNLISSNDHSLKHLKYC